jgi:hypothetical protein
MVVGKPEGKRALRKTKTQTGEHETGSSVNKVGRRTLCSSGSAQGPVVGPCKYGNELQVP